MGAPGAPRSQNMQYNIFTLRSNGAPFLFYFLSDIFPPHNFRDGLQRDLFLPWHAIAIGKDAYQRPNGQ